jgi:hypothetical protein
VNPFTKDLGVHQGRIATATAPEGSHVYELGHALLQQVNVAVGDKHTVSRTIVIDQQTQLLRASVVITTPQTLPIAAAWEVSGWLNGTKMVSRRLRPSKRVIRLDDLRISTFNANKTPSTDLLAFRLELV